MNGFEAADLLRRLAKQERDKVARYGVTETQLEAAREAMGIFSTSVVEALRYQAAAETLEWAAGVLERQARAEKTPTE